MQLSKYLISNNFDALGELLTAPCRPHMEYSYFADGSSYQTSDTRGRGDKNLGSQGVLMRESKPLSTPHAVPLLAPVQWTPSIPSVGSKSALLVFENFEPSTGSLPFEFACNLRLVPLFP